MKISIDSEQNIADVKEDISIFGADFKVFAVYSLIDLGGGREEFEYISSYVDADRPTRDEIESPSLFGKFDVPELRESDEAEYQKLVADYEANIESLSKIKHELMTLGELLEKLEEQNSIF